MGARLAFWYSLVLLAGLTLFANGIWLVVRHSLMSTVDETLAQQAKGVATVLQFEFKPTKPEHLQEELSEYAQATPEGNLIEVRNTRGEVLVGSKVLGIREAVPPAGFSREKAGGRHYRTLSIVSTVQGQTYRISVAAPLDEMAERSAAVDRAGYFAHRFLRRILDQPESPGAGGCDNARGTDHQYRESLAASGSALGGR
jgi:hypothetical protein